MRQSVIILVSLLTFAASQSATKGPRAETENGFVVGSYAKSYSGYKFRAFKGIPYAKPPLGDYRFKAPQRLKEQWYGEWNAQNYGSNCIQLDQFTRTRLENGTLLYRVIGEEDCLFINVFTQEGGPAKKNVVFMIHGGAFMFGSADMYGPEYMMDQEDIVYVTFNYRLGPMGFITTGDQVVPGNNGLKDQVAALEWVNRNIANFGGDPGKITIAGLSAGGASVDYMYLTPITKGLFQKGFAFSGSSLCSWALVQNGVERTKQLAEGLGCPVTDSRTILKCLRRRPAKQIVEQLRSFMVWLYTPFTIFGPVVEVNSSRPYLEQHPRDILQQELGHNLPLVAGVTTEEGLYPAAEFITYETLMNQLNDRWDSIGPGLLFLNPRLSQKDSLEVVQDVKQRYLKGRPISIEHREDLVALLTDRLFRAGIFEAMELRKNSYLYEYGYQSASSTAHTMSGTLEPLGASHCDDLLHVVNFTVAPSHTTPRDQDMAAVVKKIFFTFVSSGKVPDEYNWQPLSSSNSYLKISSPDDITISTAGIDLNIQRKLFKEVVLSRDEL